MSVIKTAVLTPEQKSLLKQAIFLQICDLQKSFYQDKKISERDYNDRFKKIDELTDILGIRDTYAYNDL